jgi:hypothetical protein
MLFQIIKKQQKLCNAFNLTLFYRPNRVNQIIKTSVMQEEIKFAKVCYAIAAQDS